jgi:hypothetical protein
MNLPCRDPLGAAPVEERLVLTAQFDLIESLAARHRVATDVRHMIAVVTGQMPLEQLRSVIELSDPSELPRHPVDRADAAVAHHPKFLAQLGVDVGGREQGLRLILPAAGPQPVVVSAKPCHTEPNRAFHVIVLESRLVRG